MKFCYTPNGSVACRLNGITIADARGTLEDGTGTFLLHVEDANGGSHSAVTTRIDVLHAVRSYSPNEWIDDSLDINGVIEVVIPDDLPVTIGSSGRQWAWLKLLLGDTHNLDENIFSI